MTLSIEIDRSKKTGQFFFRFRSKGNSEKLCHSESHTRKFNTSKTVDGIVDDIKRGDFEIIDLTAPRSREAK